MLSPKSVFNCSVGPAFDGACGTRPFVTFSYRMYRIVRGCKTPLGWAHLFRRSEVSGAGSGDHRCESSTRTPSTLFDLALAMTTAAAFFLSATRLVRGMHLRLS